MYVDVFEMDGSWWYHGHKLSGKAGPFVSEAEAREQAELDGFIPT